MKNKYISFTLFISLFFSSIWAQVPTYSPYTRFALGDLNQSGFGMNKALGGTSVGLRLNNQINYLNPASYSAQDTLSFLFDFGINGSIRKISSGTESKSFNEMNFDHLALSFPVTRWWGASIGILPYSKVGYNITERFAYTNFEETGFKEIRYEGTGGLNQFYIGSGFRIGKHLSVGGNFSYIFGRLTRNRKVSLVNAESGSEIAGTASTMFQNEMTMKNALFTFGIQGFKKFGKNHRVVLGLSLDNKTSLKGELNSLTYSNYSIPTDSIIVESGEGKAEIPLRLGTGFSYTYKNKLMLAFDYINQDWSNSTFFGKNDSLTKSDLFRFGLQFSPVGLTEVRRSAYWQRINFRIGGYYNKSYLQIRGNQIEDYGMTFGLGIPWKNEKNLFTNTSFNISYQVGRRGTTEKGMLKENYQIFSVGLTMLDFWFIKPKYD